MRFRELLIFVGWLACIPCSAQQRGHGTIVVVVAAKDGYALAADSQLTIEDGTGRVLEKRYDGQKLFPVGKFAACVVAGNVSSALPGDGFVLEGSLATEMATQNLVLARNVDAAEYMDADRFTQFFQARFAVVLGLLDPDGTHLENPVFGMSAVSFRPDGRRQWVSYKQNFAIRTDFVGRKFYVPGEVIPIAEPVSKVVAIGAPSDLVDELISLDGPDKAIPFTSTTIMRRYFELKKASRLDELSLSDAEKLASGLVENTIERAPEGDGVHGPIDIATLSSGGFHWIVQKNVAPSPPTFRARFTGAYAEGDKGATVLDGFECVRCVFRNETFTFEGTSDFRLVQPIFKDKCEVTLDAEAKRKMPKAVEQIHRVMGANGCKITELPVATGGIAD